MTRDVTERLALYTRADVEVRRIALNIDQVREHDPPPNFVKEADSRTPGYIEQFGDECWELDALPPTVITGLIRTEISGLIHPPTWDKAHAGEQRNRNLLDRAAENWTKVEKLLKRGQRR
jgi:hypothetical protein